ncbi:MAG: hypothetical protein CMM76_13235 [Rhodospirillaceae bacterium]|nr:hypothetical protein [Rhodospirillaceae bacterium]
MVDTVRRFSDLIAPISVKDFSNTIAAKSHFYIQGPDDKFSNVASWEMINRLLERTALWDSRLLTLAKDGPTFDAEQYCRADTDVDGHAVMRPVPSLIREHLKDGATLVLNHTDTLTPELAAVSACLRLRFGAQIKCNIYCSWQENQGFATHFDGRDVFVLHIAGKKSWNLYDGFYELPMGDSPYIFRLGNEENESLKGNCIEHVEMTPGDLLYIPRGQYHDAIASSEASLHLTFGVVPMLGINAMNMIQASVVNEPLFNEPLPHFDDPKALQAHIDRLVDRLSQMLASSEASLKVRASQESVAMQDFSAVYDLPHAGNISTFRVFHDQSIEHAATGFDLVAASEWVAERDYFTDRELAVAFPRLKPADIVRTIEELITGNRIIQIG